MSAAGPTPIECVCVCVCMRKYVCVLSLNSLFANYINTVGVVGGVCKGVFVCASNGQESMKAHASDSAVPESDTHRRRLDSQTGARCRPMVMTSQWDRE